MTTFWKLTSRFCFLIIITFIQQTSTTCLAGTGNCTLCLDSNQCKTCQTGTFLNSTSLCQICPVGCTGCTSASSCSGCTSTFLFSASGTCYCPEAKGVNYVDNTCIACQVIKCRFCTNDYRVCTYCYAGYGLTSNFDCIPCQVPNCGYCNTNATMCYEGCKMYYGKYNQSSCVPCQDVNCVWCEGNYKRCRVCVSGYGPFSGVCIACTVTNCLACSLDPSICTQCVPGYNLTDQLCSQCTISKCKLCASSTSICTNCTLGYGVQNNVCLPCLDTKCLNCTSNPNVCLTCKNLVGFGLLNQSCQACQNINCERCVGDATTCTTCLAGYGVYPGTICQKCDILRPKCLLCPNNANSCQFCEDGYGILGSGCSICTSSLCMKCPSNPSICAYCTAGYGVVTGGGCSSCTKANCAKCSTNADTCDQCNSGYGLSNGVCLTCTFCLNCSSNNYTCLKCVDKYSLTSNGSCIPCTDSKCLQCPSGASTCTLCSPGYGVTLTATCAVCNVTNCINCSPNFNICTQCQIGYGVSNGQCFACNNCLNCSINYFPCYRCIDGYSLLINGSCAECSNPNCLQCRDSVSDCQKCSVGYGVLNKTCEICSSYCLTCSQYNSSACTSCISGKYVSNSSTCQTCSASCVQCTSISQCQFCQNGYYLGLDLFCHICPNHCSLCFFNVPYSAPQCITCQNSSFSINNQNPPICQDVCGDFLAIDYTCDNSLNIDYDGCDDSCEPMVNFTCTVNNLTRMTTCMYHQKIGLKQQSYPVIMGQQINLTLSVEIPLYAFSIANGIELIALFETDNSSLVINDVKFNSSSKQFYIFADILPGFDQHNLIIQINSYNSKQDFLLLPQQYVKLNFEQSYEERPIGSTKLEKIAQIAQFLSPFSIVSYLITISAWFCLILGLIFKNVTNSLQTLTVLQVCHVCLASIDPDLVPTSLISGLKYSSGYNYHTMSTSQSRILQRQASAYIPNYFNISLILFVIPMLIILVAYILLVRFRSRNVDFKVNSNQISQQNYAFKLIKVDQYAWACLFCWAVVCAVRLSVCVAMMGRMGEGIDGLAVFVLVVTFVSIVSVALVYMLKPETFHIINSHYKPHPIFKSYPLLHTITLSIVVFLYIYVKSTWACLLPCFLFSFWTLLAKPNVPNISNFVSILHFLVLAAFIFMTLYIRLNAYNYQMLSIYLAVHLFAILPLLVFVTLFKTVLHPIYSALCESYDEQSIKQEQIKQRCRLQKRLQQFGIGAEIGIQSSQQSNKQTTNQNLLSIPAQILTTTAWKGKNSIMEIGNLTRKQEQSNTTKSGRNIGHRRRVKNDRNLRFDVKCDKGVQGRQLERLNVQTRDKKEKDEDIKSIGTNGHESQVFMRSGHEESIFSDKL